jgi:hypothetical protein
MSLQDWLRNGWLTEHESSREEIADLSSVVDRDLRDCQSRGLSTDWQLSIAYNAALQVGVAALAARLREDLVDWLQTQHPEFLPGPP